jgi:hypothetical protein
MKKYFPTSLFLLLTLLNSQCKNEVKILAPYKDIPVIYGLLDQNDSVHYIRVNKVYAGIGNAYVIAKQYDSINYPVGTITVQLQDLNTNNTVTLDTTTAISLSAGIFSYPYEVLYKTTEKLDSTHQYKLTVMNNKTGKVASGSTALLPDISVDPPNYLTNSPINIYPDTTTPSVVSWATNSRAIIYQFTMRFFYNEIDTLARDTVHSYLDWVFAAQISPTLGSGYFMSDKFRGIDFLHLLYAEISPINGRSIKRVPVSILVSFTSGSLDLNTYIQLSEPSLTVNQEKPFFTDIKNAVGIFTGRHIQSSNKPLGFITLEMIDTSSLIKPLNFKMH